MKFEWKEKRKKEMEKKLEKEWNEKNLLRIQKQERVKVYKIRGVKMAWTDKPQQMKEFDKNKHIKGEDELDFERYIES